MVALNAWLQYRDAGKLMAFVNYRRNMRLAQTPQHQAGYLFWLGGKLGMLRMSVSFIVDQLRKLLLHGPELRRFESEQQQLKNERIMSRMNKDQLPWTMDTAFYALCGGSVMLAHDYSEDRNFSRTSKYIEHRSHESIADPKSGATGPKQGQRTC
jgi:hypothetical protein